MLYTFCTKYRTDFLHLKRNCIKRNAKVVNFETDKQKTFFNCSKSFLPISNVRNLSVLAAIERLRNENTITTNSDT